MQTSHHPYHHGKQELHGFLAYPDTNKLAPGILIVHDWSGRNDFACEKAKMLASWGYVALAVDMYGLAQCGETVEEKMALMQPLINNRVLLAERMRVSFESLISLPQVDRNRIGAMGFCFGGLCVLDLARTGLDFKAAISFHGLLNRPENAPVVPIKPHILALHGYEDPMVPPEQLQQFCQEMTKSAEDWQVHMYGHTQHAFTNPKAQDNQLGTVYNARAEKRALEAMQHFLKEVF